MNDIVACYGVADIHGCQTVTTLACDCNTGDTPISMNRRDITVQNDSVFDIQSRRKGRRGLLSVK